MSLRRRNKNPPGVDKETVSIFYNDFAERHFLVFHSSISRLRRIKAQLIVNSCVDADAATTKWTERNPPTPAQVKALKNGADLNNGDGSAVTASLRPHPIVGTYNCEIRMITDPAHPAFRQYGLFATRKILGTHPLMCYSGLVSIFGSVPSSQSYVMTYGDDNGDLGIDAEFFGNFARFANDPRGTGAVQANVSAQMKHSRLGEFYTCLVTRRTIAEGEEIMLDYGKRHRLCSHLWSARSGRRLTSERQVRPVTDLAAIESNSNGSSLLAIWRCFQCGGWNNGGSLCHVPAMVAVKCVHCSQPKAADTPTAVTRFQQEDGDDDDDDDDDDEKEEEEEGSTSTTTMMFPPKNTLCSPRFVGERPVVSEKVGAGVDRHTFTITAGSSNDPVQRDTIKNRTAESSVAAEWPRQFPFVPWQIWDPEVSSFEINIQAKRPFVHQSNIAVTVPASDQQKDQQQESSSSRVTVKRRRVRSSDGKNTTTTDDDDDDDGDEDDNSGRTDEKLRAAAPSRLCLFTRIALLPCQEIAAAGGLLTDTAWRIPEQTPNALIRVKTRFISQVSSRPNLIMLVGGELDKPVASPILPAKTSPREMVSKCSSGNDDDAEQVPLDFDFYPTNEIKNIRVARNSGSIAGALPREALQQNPECIFMPEGSGDVEPNVTLHWVRDPLGFFYIGLVSLCEIDIWEELVL